MKIGKIENEFDSWLDGLESGISNLELDYGKSIITELAKPREMSKEDASKQVEMEEKKIQQIKNFSMLTRLLHARIDFEEQSEKLEDILDFLKRAKEQLTSRDIDVDFFHWFQKTRNELLMIKGVSLALVSEERRKLVSKMVERVLQDDQMMKFKSFDEFKRFNMKEINSKKFDDVNIDDAKSLKTQDIDNLDGEEAGEIDSKGLRNKFRDLEKTFFGIWEEQRNRLTLTLKKNKRFFEDDVTFKQLRILFLESEIGKKMDSYFKKVKLRDDLLSGIGAMANLSIEIDQNFYQNQIQIFLKKINTKKKEEDFIEEVTKFGSSIIKSDIRDPKIFLKILEEFNTFITKKTKSNLINLTTDVLVSFFGYLKYLKNNFSSSKRNYIVYDTLTMQEIEKSNISDKRSEKKFSSGVYNQVVRGYNSMFVRKEDKKPDMGEISFVVDYEKNGDIPKNVFGMAKKEMLTPFLDTVERLLKYHDMFVQIETIAHDPPAKDFFKTRVEKCLDKLFGLLQEQVLNSIQKKNQFFTEKMVQIVFHLDRLVQKYNQLNLNTNENDRTIELYAKAFSLKKFESFVNPYLSQNWMNYERFSRTQKPNNKFKVIESQILIKTLGEFILKESELYNCPIDRGREGTKLHPYWNSKFFFSSITKFLENLIEIFQITNPSFVKQPFFDDDVYLVLKYIVYRMGKLDLEKLDFAKFEKFRILMEYLEFIAEAFNPFNGQLKRKIGDLSFSLGIEKSYVRRYPEVIQAHYKIIKKLKKMIRRAKKSKQRLNISQTERSGFHEIRDINRSLDDESSHSSLNTSKEHLLEKKRVPKIEDSKQKYERIKADTHLCGITTKLYENIDEKTGYNFEQFMIKIQDIPDNFPEVMEFLVNLTPGKKTNQCKNRSLDRINIVKKVDIFLQRPEFVEVAGDLRPNQLEIKKLLTEVSKKTGFR